MNNRGAIKARNLCRGRRGPGTQRAVKSGSRQFLSGVAGKKLSTVNEGNFQGGETKVRFQGNGKFRGAFGPTYKIQESGPP